MRIRCCSIVWARKRRIFTTGTGRSGGVFQCICPLFVQNCFQPAHARPLMGGSPRLITRIQSIFTAQSSKMVMAEVCYPNSVQELYVFLKSIYLRRTICFKRCQLCGRLFAAADSDRTEFCSREYEKDKTCRDVGAARIYQKKLLDNPIIRAHNRAYKTNNVRIRYGTTMQKNSMLGQQR